ncbi:MAG: metallophosphoesterase [Oscillospiraceae bacterium]|nr:metallophosphoesterase [Oscillospiraceae bacterium]
MSKSANRPESRGRLQFVIRRIGLWCFVLLLFLAAAYGANNKLDISEYTYASDELSYSFDGFRIVHISDLHNKVFAQDNAAVMQEIRGMQPDIIVLTGDMIDASNHTDIPAAELFMQQVSEIAPVYYVLGNHENLLDKADLTAFEEKIREYGIVLLENERVQIPSKTGQTISLIGMDDNSLQANLLQTLAEEAPDDFCILLAHEPQYLEEYYAKAGVDLVFSGHAHGGQFRIPFTHQGIWAPDQGFLPELTEGCVEAKSGDTTMYISRGLGNSSFPLRLANHPEIICVTLRVSS